MKVFDFNESLVVGKSAEDRFLRLFNNRLVKSNCLEYDFLDLETGHKIELKTESYSGSPNLFIERLSNMEMNTLGGPWRALNHGVDTYIHWFPDNYELFSFHPCELVHLMEDLIKKNLVRRVEVQNKTHMTLGYTVRKTLLKDISRRYVFKHGN